MPTCDEQETRRQLLEEHDSLALVAASNQDENCAGGDARANATLVLVESVLAGLDLVWSILSWVVFGLKKC